MKFFKKTIPVLINKYTITIAAFLVWVIIFDRNNLIFSYNLKSQLNKLKKEKEYYSTEIKKNKEAIKELTTNNKTLEKFAREKYLMKKENEDIFVIIRPEKDSLEKKK